MGYHAILWWSMELQVIPVPYEVLRRPNLNRFCQPHVAISDPFDAYQLNRATLCSRYVHIWVECAFRLAETL